MNRAVICVPCNDGLHAVKTVSVLCVVFCMFPDVTFS